MADLLKLAERCEAATGPGRLLNLEIAVAVGHRPEWLAGSDGELWIDRSDVHAVLRWADAAVGRSAGNPTVDDPPSYTASLDAVMKLEPEGLESEEIYPPDAECPVWTSHIVIRGDFHAGTGSTRVLAQLASRLRARAGEQS